MIQITKMDGMIGVRVPMGWNAWIGNVGMYVVEPGRNRVLDKSIADLPDGITEYDDQGRCVEQVTPDGVRQVAEIIEKYRQ